jgi:uracil-DNA glycosylase
MNLSTTELSRFRKLAENLPGLDKPVYEAFGRDPLAPILGLGPPKAPVCVFGRDPGRNEVEAGKPFVGAAGRGLRDALARHARTSHERVDDRFDDDGLPVFWLNTVPYKRVANKAWPVSVIRAFQPLIRDTLLGHWQGEHVLTLGTQAFEWFMPGQPPAEQRRMTDFWSGKHRYDDTLRVHLANEREGRWLTLYPLPHPSPANAVWRERFPRLLERRLESIFRRP